MDDLKPEGWLAVIVAIGGSIWTAIHLFFNLKSDVKSHAERIEAQDKRLEAHDHEFGQLRDSAERRFDQVRADIHRVSDQTERRHDSIEAKIDRLLLERGRP